MASFTYIDEEAPESKTERQAFTYLDGGNAHGPKSGVLRQLADVPIGLVGGVAGLIPAVIGLGDIATGGTLGNAVDAAGSLADKISLPAALRPTQWQNQIQDYYSPEMKGAKAASHQVAVDAEQKAKAEGSDWKGQIGASALGALKGVAENPRAGVAFITENYGGMKAIAKGTEKVLARYLPEIDAAVKAGTMTQAQANARVADLAGKISPVGEGILTAGQGAQQVREENPAATAADYLLQAPAGFITGAIARGVGRIPGLENAEATMALNAMGRPSGFTGDVLKRVGKGILSEGVLQEVPQSMQEQAWVNAATGKPLQEGVGEAAVQGLVAGGAMGGGAAGMSGVAARARSAAENAAAAAPGQLPATGQAQDSSAQALVAEALAAETAAQPATTSNAPAVNQPSAAPSIQTNQAGSAGATNQGEHQNGDQAQVALAPEAGQQGVGEAATTHAGRADRSAEGGGNVPGTGRQGVAAEAQKAETRADFYERLADEREQPGPAADPGRAAQYRAKAAELRAEAARSPAVAAAGKAKAVRGWQTFPADSGTLGIPRADMPQVKSAHRGAMVQFLAARGVQHQQEEVAADSLRPTQAEFSPAKVKKAAEFTGNNRSILVSSDGHVLDGHHQWLAALAKGEPVKVIRLDAPISKLIELAREFPSSTTSKGKAPTDKQSLSVAPVQPPKTTENGNPAIDLSKRTDKQLAYLSTNGQPGYKEAAIAEIDKRAGKENRKTGKPENVEAATVSGDAGKTGKTGNPENLSAITSRQSPIQKRDDLIGAIMRVTGGDGINSSMALDTTGDDANKAPKLRGLFTPRGTQDLGDTAMLLRTEEGYDVRDGEHLAELIRQAEAGDVPVSMERMQRDKEADLERQHRDRIRAKAKKLGIRTVGVKFSDVDAAVLEEEQRRHNTAVEKLTERDKRRFDAAVEQSKALVSDAEIRAILRDLDERGISGREKWREGLALVRQMAEDASFQQSPGEIEDATATSEEPDWFKDFDDEGDRQPGSRVTNAADHAGDEGRGGGEASKAEQGRGHGEPGTARSSGEAGDQGDGREARFELTGQSAAEVADDEAAKAAAQQAAVASEAKDGWVKLWGGMALPSSAPAVQNPFAEQSSSEAGKDAATPSGQSLDSSLASQAADGKPGQEAVTPANTGDSGKELTEPDRVPESSSKPALPIVEHVTAKGKTLRGTIRKDLTLEQAKAIDRFTFKKDGGYFVREDPTPGAAAPTGEKSAVADEKPARSMDQAKKLRVAGEKVIADAEEVMGRDRLTNTAKRAREASYAESQAAQNKAIGETMLRIADAIEDGSAKHLAGITARTQVEQLDSIMVQAKYATDTAKGGYSLREANKGRPFSDEDLSSVKMPIISMWGEGRPKSNLIDAINGKRGAPALRAEILRSDGYTQAIHDKVKTILSENVIKDVAGGYAIEALSRVNRLARAGINNVNQLRSAISEYAKIRAAKTETNRAKALERALIGQKVGIDFFPTPKAVAADMVRMADIQPGMKVLEPSAGNGNIAEAIQAAGVSPDVVELSSSLREILEAKGFSLVGQDFMDTTGKYDRIIMNPPFSNRLDAAHVQHAYSLLNPGGKIVAIMGEGVFFGDDAKAKQFREWLDSVGGTSEKLPKGTFTDRTLMATTGVNSRMVEIEKPEDIRYNVATDTLSSPSDRAIYDMAGEGKSAAEILSFISKASRRPFNRYLANALNRIGVSSTVKLDSQGGWKFGNTSRAQRYAAAYNPRTDAVALFTPREAERHVLHELVHAATLKAIAKGGPAATQMKALFDHLQSSPGLAGQYGMMNLDEFVAEAFSNPLFQQALKNAPAPRGSSLKSAWDAFVRMVAKMLGFKSPQMETALDRAMVLGAELMRENAALAGNVSGNVRGNILDGVGRRAGTFDEARKAASEFQGKPLTNAATKMVATLSRNNLDKMLNSKAVGKSETPTLHALAVANIDALFERAILGWSKQDRNADPNIVAIHRFFASLATDQGARIAKLTIKETAQAGRPNSIYSVEAVELNEKSPAAKWVGEIAEADGIDPRTTRSAGDVLNLAESVQKGNTGEFSPDNPDIRYNIANDWYNGPSGAPVRNAWQAAKAKAAAILAPKTLDKVIYELQDKFIDLRRLRDYIKSIGGAITDMNDAYLGEELYHKRLAHRVETFAADELRPLLAEMRIKGVGMNELETFLHARHAPEANAEMAKRNPNQNEIDAGHAAAAAAVRQLETQLQHAKATGTATVAIEKALNDARGDLSDWNGAQAFHGTEDERLSLSGMSDAAAAAIMAKLSPARRAALDALAARVDAINEGTVQLLDDYGLMSKDALRAWKATYKNYIPLHRDEAHPDSNTHPIGQGFSTKGDASKRRTGSNAKVTNILGHIAMQRESALTRGEKNHVMLKLYLMARQNPLPDVWKVGAVPKIDTIDKATGFVRSVPDPLYKNRPNIVMLRIAGKDVAITMNENNPEALRMAHALKNLDVDDLHYLIPVVGKMTRWFAAVNTQYNPIFGVINMLRDTQEAALNLSTTPLAGKQGEILRDTLSILKDVVKNKGRMPKTGQWADLFMEMGEVGGTTGYRDLFLDAESRSKALLADMKALDSGKAMRAWKGVTSWLSDYNEAMENATRLAAYKAALDNGMSKERAASLAKNLTVNFNRKGRQTRELGALYAFFNAAVQGTARMAQTLAGPAGRKIMAGGVMLGALNALMGIAVMGSGGGDDDDEWDKIPEFVKERSIIIPIGKQDYITIPMPLGFQFLPNIGRLAVEMAVYKDKTAGKQFASLFSVLADAFNPLGGSSPPLQIISPTVMDPFVALAQNKDWTGRPIYRENRSGLDPDPGFKLSKDSATLWAKLGAEMINAITGGTQYTPGGWSPTPDQIDYVIGQITGGVGREAGKVAATAAAPFTGEELPAYKIPLVGRLYGNTSGASGQSQKFYENITRANEAENEIKGRLKAGLGIADFLQDNPQAVALAAQGNAAERQASLLRKMRSEIVERGGPDKAARVREVNERIAAVMRGFNRQVDQLEAR